MIYKEKPSEKITLTSLALKGIFFCCLLFSSSQSNALDLQTALQLTLQNNAALAAERESILATNEQYRQAIAAVYPQLSASLSGSASNSINYTYNGNNWPSEFSSESWSSGSSASLNLSQALYSGGAVSSGIRRVEANIRSAWEGLHSTQQNQLNTTAQYYLELFAAQEQVKLSQSSQETARQQLDAAQARYDAGVYTKTEVSQAQAAYARATSNVSQAKQQLIILQANLSAQVGQPVYEPINNADLPLDLPSSRDEALALAQQHSPSLKAASFNVEAAALDVEIKKASLRPSASATASATRNWSKTGSSSSLDPDLGATNSYNVGVSISVPLYSGGGTLAEIRAAKHQASQARLNLEAARQSLKSTVAQTYESFQAYSDLITAQGLEVEAARQALEATRAQEDEGLASNYDVILQTQAWYDAQFNLLKSKTQRITAAYALISSIGLLSPQRVGLVAPSSSAQDLSWVKNNVHGHIGTGAQRFSSFLIDDLIPPAIHAKGKKIKEGLKAGQLFSW